ncbi:MAG: hypothetical protein AAB400_02120 [Patescibacteria group bacterium]
MTWTIQTIETVLSYPKAVMTLEIPGGASGRKIIDAARDSIEENKQANQSVDLVEEYYYRDDDILFVFGQQSLCPYEDIILAVDAGRDFTHLILPEGGYTRVRVISHEWPSRKLAVGYGDEQIAEACRHFRDQLASRLNIPSQPGE